MTDTITLEEIAQTDLGREIVRQRDARLAAEQEAADGKRKDDLADALEELRVTASAYDALRPEALRLLGELAAHVDRLLTLRNRLDATRGRIQKLGGELPDGFPITMMGAPEFKAAVNQAREIATKVGGSL